MDRGTLMMTVALLATGCSDLTAGRVVEVGVLLQEITDNASLFGTPSDDGSGNLEGGLRGNALRGDGGLDVGMTYATSTGTLAVFGDTTLGSVPTVPFGTLSMPDTLATQHERWGSPPSLTERLCDAVVQEMLISRSRGAEEVCLAIETGLASALGPSGALATALDDGLGSFSDWTPVPDEDGVHRGAEVRFDKLHISGNLSIVKPGAAWGPYDGGNPGDLRIRLRLADLEVEVEDLEASDGVTGVFHSVRAEFPGITLDVDISIDEHATEINRYPEVCGVRFGRVAGPNPSPSVSFPHSRVRVVGHGIVPEPNMSASAGPVGFFGKGKIKKAVRDQVFALVEDLEATPGGAMDIEQAFDIDLHSQNHIDDLLVSWPGDASLRSPGAITQVLTLTEAGIDTGGFSWGNIHEPDGEIERWGPLTFHGDQWHEDIDNCPESWNPLQTDADFDGVGDQCDPLVDLATTRTDLAWHQRMNCPIYYVGRSLDLNQAFDPENFGFYDDLVEGPFDWPPEYDEPFAGNELLEAYQDQALMLGLEWFYLYDDPNNPFVFTDAGLAESIARGNLALIGDHLGDPAIADLPFVYVEVQPGHHLLQVPASATQALEPAEFDLVMLALPERLVVLQGQ